jgi:hypothetical protein
LLPFVKPIFLIVNGYAWLGDARSLIGFAPLWLYIRRLFFKPIFFGVSSWLYVHYGIQYNLLVAAKMDYVGTCLQLFPNVLGFGIGVYALIFAFPSRFMTKLEKRKAESISNVGAHGVNSLVAFPLLLLALILFACVLLKAVAIEMEIIEALGLFGLTYGIWLSIDLIGVLYASARKVIRNNLESDLN